MQPTADKNTVRSVNWRLGCIAGEKTPPPSADRWESRTPEVDRPKATRKVVLIFPFVLSAFRGSRAGEPENNDCELIDFRMANERPRTDKPRRNRASPSCVGNTKLNKLFGRPYMVALHHPRGEFFPSPFSTPHS